MCAEFLGGERCLHCMDMSRLKIDLAWLATRRTEESITWIDPDAPEYISRQIAFKNHTQHIALSLLHDLLEE